VEAKRAVPRSESCHNQREIRSSESEKLIEKHPNSLGNCSDESFGLSDSNCMVEGNTSTNKIFVGGLHYETRDGSFRAYFEKYGKVSSAEVMFNRETHKSRGFGFIVFESNESVDKVLECPHHTLNGKVVEVKRAVPRSQNSNFGSININTAEANKLGGKSSRREPNSQSSKAGSTKKKMPVSSVGSPSLSSAPVNIKPVHTVTSKSPSKFTGENSYAAALRFGNSRAPKQNTQASFVETSLQENVNSSPKMSAKSLTEVSQWPHISPTVDAWNQNTVPQCTENWIPQEGNSNVVIESEELRGNEQSGRAVKAPSSTPSIGSSSYLTNQFI
jgi:RNA-binding protein Musashi